MKPIRKLTSRIFNLYFLLFLNGFLVCLYITFQIADDYENRIFAILSNNISEETHLMPEDSVVSNALHTCHMLINSRSKIFYEHNKFSRTITPTDYAASLSGDLMTAEGACGSYSKVMAKLAENLGFECRIGQMKVKGLYGGHIIPEIKTSKGWVVVDPMYDLHFTKPDGNWASFADVSADWAYYKKQLPANYDMQYSYDGVRYTNWNKIPVVLPIVKTGLDLVMGKEKADQLSIRTNLLSIYKVYSIIVLMLIIPISFYLLIAITRIKFPAMTTLRPNKSEMVYYAFHRVK